MARPRNPTHEMNRAPVTIRGLELSGELFLSRQWKASALYSRIRGYTTFVKDGPLDKQMGINDINPARTSITVTGTFENVSLSKIAI